MFGKKPGSDGTNGVPRSSSTTPPTSVPAGDAQDGYAEDQASNDSAHRQMVPVGAVESVSSRVAVRDEQQLRTQFGQERQATRSSSIHAELGVETLRFLDKNLETPKMVEVRNQLIAELVDKIDINTIYQLSEDRRKKRMAVEIAKLLQNIEAPLTSAQLSLIQDQVIDEVLGFGPLEPLLRDPDVSDIMINTAKQVFIERQGKIYLSDVTFVSESHLMAIIQRIVTRVGRRIDEASPMVDARLPDGSRFNAIIPPLALDGALVSIRKFKKNKITLSDYVNYDSLTPEMARFLSICGEIRLNIIISGGTGSGKTTLLNAISNHIGKGERVITIEDAAELQLAQPHVLRLETRPSSAEGVGEITQRQLVKNALRMRPDRIILGEIRGDEVIDVLSAMNTGHDGSLATIHSNSPRDCLSRIENLVNMSGVKVSDTSLRYQISSAVQLIVQLQRMRDGRRRITHIEEVVGVEGDVMISQTLFSYKSKGMDAKGNLLGEFKSHGIRPRFLPRAEYFNREQDLLECLGLARVG
ncbi:MAG: CpaF family protein [Alphaproteobacteria bacterium]|nr:MAG: CpaF family protein [Alphaproteobacteria bacterium]TAF39379.1 MAG: CpaF family protein [Alphaproteobacteria bacterium]TAF77193.1 MAG: CpaF family protein [Alphaproteobacteria bacterium]